MTAPKNIDVKQKKIIWSLAKKELGMDSETLYALLMEMFSVERMSALTWNQAEIVIRELRRKATNLSPDRLTPPQYRGIMHRADALGWSKSGLKKYIKAETGVDEVSWLTVGQARVAIAGMEKIKKWREKNPKAEGIDGIQ